jgi:hypothetical protein
LSKLIKATSNVGKAWFGLGTFDRDIWWVKWSLSKLARLLANAFERVKEVGLGEDVDIRQGGSLEVITSTR